MTITCVFLNKHQLSIPISRLSRDLITTHHDSRIHWCALLKTQHFTLPGFNQSLEWGTRNYKYATHTHTHIYICLRLIILMVYDTLKFTSKVTTACEQQKDMTVTTLAWKHKAVYITKQNLGKYKNLKFVTSWFAT
jgi:hypothetical protein